MRQIVKFLFVVLVAGLFLFLLQGEKRVGAFVSGPDPGNTGAPGEGTCAGCHFGGSPGGQLRLDGVPQTYTPNQEVTLTVVLSQAGRVRFGFQATVIDDEGRAAGEIILTDTLRTQLKSGNIGGNERTYIEHTQAGTGNSGTASWSFRWRAPAASTGRVTFYVAGNAANNNSTSFGDSIYLTQGSATAPVTIPALASVSAASFAGDTAVAPNSIVAAFSAGELASGVAAATTDPLPQELLGTTVRITDSAMAERGAGLFFVSAGQINFEIPGGTASGMATVKVVRNNQTVAQGTVQIDSVSPGIFRVLPSNPSNILAAAQVFRLKGDGSNGTIETIVRFDNTVNPPVWVAIPIEFGPPPESIFLILYATGLRFNSGLSGVTAKIGGETVPVGYASNAPGFVALDQVNLTLPRSMISRGNVNVELTVDGKPANVVVINVK